jgi:hypothetical protein
MQVHAGGPNDTAATDDTSVGERPILQITYCRRGYDDQTANYGYEELFCD